MQMQSPKHALNMCDKYLKKHPKCLPLIVVKAYICTQSGRDSDAQGLIEPVVATIPTDLPTLTQLDRVYVALNDYKSAAALLEKSFSKHPAQEIGVLWFVSLVRLQDAKKLCTVALRLGTLFKYRRYTFWAIVSLVLSSFIGSENPHIKLAEKMVLKADAEGQIRGLEELLICIQVLQKAKSFDQALMLLDKHQQLQFPNPDERFLLRLQLLDATCRTRELYEATKSHILKCGITDWTVWMLFAKCNIECKEVETKIMEKKTRSYQLAVIDYCRQILKDASRTVDSIIDFTSAFKESAFVLPDLKHIIDQLPPEALNLLSSRMLEYRKEAPFWIRVLALLGIDTAEPASFETADGHYARAIYSKDLSMVERGICLQKCLELEPDNFIASLALICICIKLGAIESAARAFKTLDVKQVQLDTLAYLISDHVIDLGDFAFAELFLHEVFYIYDDCRSQSWSLISEAFERGSYSNLPDFFDFIHRLEHSIHAVSCILGTIRLEILKKPFADVATCLASIRPDELSFDEEFMKNLSDNRDSDIIKYIDQTGNFGMMTVFGLPAFDHSSVCVFVFLSQILRSLILNQIDSVPRHISEFENALSKYPAKQPIMIVKAKFLLEFSKGLFKYHQENADFEHVLGILDSDFSESFGYEKISKSTALTECYRWAALFVSFYLRHVQRNMSKMVNQIKSCLTDLQSVSLYDPAAQVSSPFESEIVSQWKKADQSVKSVCLSTIRELD